MSVELLGGREKKWRGAGNWKSGCWI